MSDLDLLLRDSAERWIAEQPAAPELRMLVSRSLQRSGRRKHTRAYALCAAVACVVLIATGVYLLNVPTSGDHPRGSTGVYQFHQPTKLGSLIPGSQRKPTGAVQAPYLDGNGTFQLSADIGKVVVVNYWATWCSPCRTETAQLDPLYRSLRNQGVTVVGIDTHEARRNLAGSYVHDNNISYPMAYDKSGETLLSLGNIPPTLPVILLIDKQGRVAAVYRGPLEPKKIIPALTRLRSER